MINKVELLTQRYWNISIAYENRPEGDGQITTTTATRQLGQALTELNPNRLLVRKIFDLQQHIITGGKLQCQASTTTPAKLIPLIKQ